MPRYEGFIVGIVMGKHLSTSVIACYDFDGKLVKVYKTAKEASDNLNLFSRSVDKAIRYHTTVGHYQWRRYMNQDDVETSIEPYQKQEISKESVKVAMTDEEGNIIKIYPSISQASKENNISPKQIRECLLLHQKKAGNRFWKKID